MRAAALAFALVLTASGAGAVQPDEMLKDPALEGRARTISAGLRCLVCQNQSIDDSSAPLARDLRLIVRERLQAGDTDAQVRDFLVARYGAFVLLQPPFNAGTALLWGTPVLALLLGAIVAWAARRSRDIDEPAPLTPEEEAEVAALTAGGPS